MKLRGKWVVLGAAAAAVLIVIVLLGVLGRDKGEPGRPSKTGAELLKRGKVVGISVDVWVRDLEKRVEFEATPEEIDQIMSVLGEADAAPPQNDVVWGGLRLRYEGLAPLEVGVMERTFQVYHETAPEDDYQLVNDGRIREVLRRILVARLDRDAKARATQPTMPQPREQGVPE